LPKLAGMAVGESTVERLAEDVGGLLGDELEEGSAYGQDAPWEWHRDKEGRTVAYVSIDATGVPQQGEGGSKAEGRMPFVAMVYSPPPERDEDAKEAQSEPGSEGAPRRAPRPRRRGEAGKAPEMKARYLAGLYALPLLGLLLRKQAAQVGMESAEQWVALSDGGNGLEDFLRKNFNRPDLAVVLDFWHPASRLEELAKLWHEGDEEAARARALEWCGKLKREGGEKLLAHLRSLPPPRRKAAKEKRGEMLGYLENQKHRMDYPSYVRKGWQIGSGPVESACKTVVGQRLKLAGMRWGEEGTDHVCHLRALLRSDQGQWEAFWTRKVNRGSLSHTPK
jgi:hypothetical protein